MIGQYIIQKHLGEGSYGTVKLARHELTGEKVAIKISTESEITREFDVLKNLSHQNIISVKEILKIPLASRSKPSHERGMVMDCVEGGDLIQYITKSGPMSEKTAMKFLVQILSALNHCHTHQYAHRDVKPDNILFDRKTGNLVLCDFGLAIHCPSNRFIEGKVGSLLYCAPEVLCDVSYLGPQVDVWSAGVVFYCMLSGCVPWEGADLVDQLENAMKGNYYRLHHLSKDSQSLIASMVSVNADKRPTTSQLLDKLTINLSKYRSSKSILFNQSLYIEEDGAGADIDCDEMEDEEGKTPRGSPKAGASKYNFRVITESEIKDLESSMYQLAHSDADALCKSLELAFQSLNINYKTNNRKKSWIAGACFKYQCKNERSRFDIEICSTKDKKSNTKVLMCRNIKGDYSNAMSLLHELYNKTPNV